MEKTYEQNGYDGNETTVNANTVNGSNSQQEPEVYTSDTGYFNEDVLQKYANVILIVTIVLCVIFVVASTAVAGKFGNAISGFALSSIISLIVVLIAYVVRAFIMVLANISINIHELNMKVR